MVRYVNEDGYFGERALLTDEPRSATVLPNGEVVLFRLHKDHFLRAVDDRVRQALLHRMRMQDDEVALEDL
ncbi:MAG: cyclic nucleotide-binding domain-containing protein [Kangiellaceae bacterium]|nr:cyclic nucleotide-binding domain-containing protein [Kangiellaceae bacterium]